MDFATNVLSKREKLIHDKLYHYLREKYDPKINAVNKDFKGVRLESELKKVKEDELQETIQLEKKLEACYKKVQSAIQKREPVVTFTLWDNKKNETDELVFSVFSLTMEAKGYTIQIHKDVDIDRFLDYYEPYTSYNISLL